MSMRLRGQTVAFAVIAALLLTVIAMVVTFPAWLPQGPRLPQITFESSAWKQAADVGDGRTIRSKMITDLLQRYSFKGRTAEEVFELLGKPDVENWNGWDFGYRLG